MAVINAIDLFCGAGGSSWGAQLAGAKIRAGFDANELAGEAFQRNFRAAKFFSGQLEDATTSDFRTAIGKVDLILASPECTNHSNAKGARPRCERSRDTAFQVVRFARMLEPRWIVIENVASMRHWSRYEEFIAKLNRLGYQIRQQVLNAVDFRVPQKRRRLFVLCDRQKKPDVVLAVRGEAKTAGDVIRKIDNFAWSPLWTKRRATATLERAERAISELGKKQAFLIVYYGSDGAGGWQSLDEPLRTITTLDRFALVRPSQTGHRMRMLQIPELKAAMGMPQHFAVMGTRRDGIRMLGNGVCPPVMRMAVKTLTKEAA